MGSLQTPRRFPGIIRYIGADRGRPGLILRNLTALTLLQRAASARIRRSPSVSSRIEKDIAREDAVSIRLRTAAHGCARL